ncbi:MAG TPA: DbpA RNA binding domain-containing protein [Gemmatimonadaceae bacterium]|nr:DbpA RNA binding domain-containing protein [Gemmatimonadaceae bacterium]
MPRPTNWQTVVKDEVDHEAKDPGVTRGQNVVYQMPHDWGSIAHVLAPLIERTDDASSDVQLLIVCADAEAAASASASVVRLAGPRTLRAIAATSERRATRLLRVGGSGGGGAQVVAGAPPELLALVQGSSLKLQQIRCVVLAWVDELIASGEESMLETLMAEIPKDAARIVVANEINAEVEALIERYARRARRVAPSADVSSIGIGMQYVSVSASSRLAALRRLLDDIDPLRGVVYVRGDESEREVNELLRALGYGHPAAPDEATVRVARAAGAGESDVVVLYDIPASQEELREAIGPHPQRVIALAQPRLLASLRVLSGGAPLTPFTLSEAGMKARTREELARSELRETLSSGSFARELLALEPLLEHYDGIEIAAATLRLLDQARFERDAARARAAEARTVHGGAGVGGTTPMTRLFINVGAMDNARPGDLVGAITNEARITSAQIGKIDIRENHSLVEVAADVAEGVVAKLTGSTVRGRRVVARVDQERGGRPGGGGRGGRLADRGSRRDSDVRRNVGRDRNERDSGVGGGERGADRSARPPRPGDTE